MKTHKTKMTMSCSCHIKSLLNVSPKKVRIKQVRIDQLAYNSVKHPIWKKFNNLMANKSLTRFFPMIH